MAADRADELDPIPGERRRASSMRSLNRAYSSRGLARLSSVPSASKSTGVGIVASTVKGPVTRVMSAISSGLSTNTSSFGGSPLAIALSVM